MGLFSRFTRSTRGGEPGRAEPPDADAFGLGAQQARAQAKMRLIGAAILLLVGVVAFALVFETTPRPQTQEWTVKSPTLSAGGEPISTPPERVAVAPVRPPPEEEPPAASAAVRPIAPIAPSASVVTAASSAQAATAGAAAPATKVGSAAEAPPAQAAAKPTAKAAASAPAKPAAMEPAPQISKDSAKEKAKEKALSKPVAPKAAASGSLTADDYKLADSAANDAGRFVVQVGAFAEAESARAARQRVEALGLKTYTQVIESSSGRRIRVRVGPFGQRAQADSAAAKIKAAGMSAAVLVL